MGLDIWPKDSCGWAWMGLGPLRPSSQQTASLGQIMVVLPVDNVS